MEKIVDKILDILPVDGDGFGITESEVLEGLGISHGSFFYSIKSLLDSGQVLYNTDKNRAKYYYKVADNIGPPTDKPPDALTQKKTVKKSDKEKVMSLINADYDDNFQGIFPSKAAFLNAVSNMDGYQYDYESKELRRVFIVLQDDDGDQNILRYDYDILPSGAFEFWRYRIRQTYKRRGLIESSKN